MIECISGNKSTLMRVHYTKYDGKEAGGAKDNGDNLLAYHCSLALQMKMEYLYCTVLIDTSSLPDTGYPGQVIM